MSVLSAVTQCRIGTLRLMGEGGGHAQASVSLGFIARSLLICIHFVGVELATQ